MYNHKLFILIPKHATHIWSDSIALNSLLSFNLF